MLINGKEFPSHDPVEIRNALLSLPSAFPDFLGLHPDATYKLPEPLELLIEEGNDAWVAKDFTLATQKMEKALQMLDATQDNKVARRKIYYCLAYCGTDLSEKIDYLQNVIPLLAETFAYTELSHATEYLVQQLKNAGKLEAFKAEQTLLLEDIFSKRNTPLYDRKHEIIVSKYLAAIAEDEKDMTKACIHRAELYALQQGPLYRNVLSVNERAVGFSDKVPMGTANIQQCTVIIVRDPKTKKSALVHFNATTDPTSLEMDVLSKFSDSDMLEVRLIGSREAVGRPNATDAINISEANLEKVFSVLSKQPNVNIVSASIWTVHTPQAIIYYPETDQLINGVAVDSNPSTEPLAIKRAFFSNNPATGGRLNFMFDVTEAASLYAAVHLPEEMVKFIQEEHAKTLGEIYSEYLEEFQEKQLPKEHIAYLYAICGFMLREHHEEITNHLILEVKQQLGEEIDDAYLEEFIAAQEKHVGYGAAAINQANACAYANAYMDYLVVHYAEHEREQKITQDIMCMIEEGIKDEIDRDAFKQRLRHDVRAIAADDDIDAEKERIVSAYMQEIEEGVIGYIIDAIEQQAEEQLDHDDWSSHLKDIEKSCGKNAVEKNKPLIDKYVEYLKELRATRELERRIQEESERFNHSAVKEKRVASFAKQVETTTHQWGQVL